MPSTVPLTLALSTLSKTPPESQPTPSATIVLTITNPSSTPYTILTWSSPLDTLVVQLGLLSVARVSTGSSVPVNAIMLKRLVPPPEDAYATILPGGSAQREVTLRAPAVELDGLVGEMIKVGWGEHNGLGVLVWEGGREVIPGCEDYEAGGMRWNPEGVEEVEVMVNGYA